MVAFLPVRQIDSTLKGRPFSRLPIFFFLRTKGHSRDSASIFNVSEKQSRRSIAEANGKFEIGNIST